MGNAFKLNRSGLLVAAVAAFAGCAVAEAAYAQRSSELAPGVSLHGDAGAPDVSGLWLGTLTGIPGEHFPPGRGPADNRPATYWAPWPLPYTPVYQKMYDERVAAAKAGRQLGDIGAKCLPFGLPQMLVSKVYPDEILQTPGQVTLFIFGTFPVVIWTDGRGHPKDLAPSYNGHSIGHWEGDTLHVDTVGINETTALDVRRNPHSPKLHVEWTMQRVASDVLHLDITLYDEDAFTEPVTTTNIWHRKSGPGWQVMDDASCWENSSPDHGTQPGFAKF